jgi:hypothetical protein
MKESFDKTAGKFWLNWLWDHTYFLPSDRKITVYHAPNTIYLLSVINLGLFKYIIIHIVTYIYFDIFFVYLQFIFLKFNVILSVHLAIFLVSDPLDAPLFSMYLF